MPRPGSLEEAPQIGADARESSAALRALVNREIVANEGWISFARYMELVLYAPRVGYYTGGGAKLGEPGDFVTAPEMGTLFGRTLARFAEKNLRPGDAILEFGAGSGALAGSLLNELERCGHRTAYFIVEASGELSARQRERLGSRVLWLDRLPEGFRGIMIANEVLDAMPVHRVAWSGGQTFECGVSLDAAENFRWSDRPADGAVLDAARRLPVPRVEGLRYESEIGLVAEAWTRRVAASLERGVLLVIDYGFPRHEFYHPQRREGTLMCHFRHHAHPDPFHLPGLQDITAHVDFDAIIGAGRDAGLDVQRYSSQARFLIDHGITECLAEVDAADVRRFAPLAAEAGKLLSPAEMGELFKVLVLERGTETG